jgi:hypothetical protein
MSKNKHRRKQKAKRKMHRHKMAMSLKKKLVAKPPKAKKAVKRQIKKILLDFGDLKI